MRLAIDCDGVLANFTDAFVKALGETSTRYLVEAPYSPAVWDWPQAVGYTDAEVTRAWARVHCDPYFWQTLKPLPGAERFLDRLWRWVATENWSRGESHEVYFVTNRAGARAKCQTERWLSDHGYGGKPPTVLIARGEKGPLVPALGLTHLIDDRPANLTSAMICGLPKDHAVLYRARYNHYFEDETTHPAAVSTFDELCERWKI